MNLVMFSWFVSSDAFGNIAEIDLKTILYKDRIQEIEDDILPFGVIVDSAGPTSDHEKMVEQMKTWKDL